MQNVVDKAREVGNDQIMVCERGVSFGYNTLVSDMRGLAIMRSTGCPVVFDATHSCSSRVDRARPAAASANSCRCWRARRSLWGWRGVRRDPSESECALSDGPNAWPLGMLKELLETLKDIDALVKQRGFIEHKLMKT